jgi:hypothetical protein
VDLTKSNGFAYVGCGSDPGGQPRTLQGNRVSNFSEQFILSFEMSLFNVSGVLRQYSRTILSISSNADSENLQVNNQTGMTVEYCVDYYVSQGFSVAGKNVPKFLEHPEHAFPLRELY